MSAQARRRVVEEPSQAFSDWHRDLPSWYTMIDLDAVYYDRTDYTPYLLVEVITVRSGDLSAPHETHALYEHKRRVYRQVAEALEVPAYTVWTTEACNEFVVQEIGTDGLERYRGDDGYADFVDRFRLGGAHRG